MKKPLEMDYSNSRYFPKSNVTEPVVSVEQDQEVTGVILGPNGKPLVFKVANPKLPIGYQRIPKEL